MSTNINLMSKKIRTEYMKKFRDPKWETLSKCYEDCVKYRLTRRLMEQTHRPLFEDGWDSGSDSSGRSSPKMHKVNHSNAKQYLSSSESKNRTAEVRNSWKPQVNGEVHTDTSAALESSTPIENGCKGARTTNGPSEPVTTRRPRHRVPRSELCCPKRELDRDESHLCVLRKPSRAKSQPPGNTKDRIPNRDNRRSFIQHDWADRHIETRDRRTPNIRTSMSTGEIHWADVGVQTRRESEKRGRGLDQRRARSADLEKCRRSEPSVAEERWTTEYMRCFSARLR